MYNIFLFLDDQFYNVVKSNLLYHKIAKNLSNTSIIVLPRAITCELKKYMFTHTNIYLHGEMHQQIKIYRNLHILYIRIKLR